MRRASRVTPERVRPTHPTWWATFALVLGSIPAHAAEGGLELMPDVNMLVGLIVLFVIIVFPLNAFFFRPLLKTLEEREERIDGTRRKAEKLEQDAARVLDEYQTAVRQAREEAEAGRRAQLDTARTQMLETTGNARSDAERDLERARGELAAALDAARDTMRTQAQDLAREAASRVLGRAV